MTKRPFPFFSVLWTFAAIVVLVCPDPSPVLMPVYIWLDHLSARQWFTVYFGVVAAVGWIIHFVIAWSKARWERKHGSAELDDR